MREDAILDGEGFLSLTIMSESESRFSLSEFDSLVLLKSILLISSKKSLKFDVASILELESFFFIFEDVSPLGSLLFSFLAPALALLDPIDDNLLKPFFPVVVLSFLRSRALPWMELLD